MKAKKTIVEEFIENNGLDFSGTGSDLNGNCVILAGFISYKVDTNDEGLAIIENLKLSTEASEELFRVFKYAWDNSYFMFWDTPEAREKYKF